MDDADGQALFDAVRVGMNKKKKDDKKVEEEIDLWMVAPKLDPRGLRENYFRKNIFNIGDMVENLNTGLVGRIIRRGTSYVICVTENKMMFKSWIKDINEVNNFDKITAISGVPAENRLVGTDKHRKYAETMVKGSSYGLDFINKYRKRS